MKKVRFETCITAINRFHFKYDPKSHKDSMLSLQRDPDNPYDSNCINVFLDNKQIGYIKATEARIISPVLDKLSKDYKVQDWRVMKATSGYLIVKVLIIA